MRHSAFDEPLTREQLVSWFRALRVRSARIFDLAAPHAYYDRPIPLRNPIVFYEGHLPAFAINTLAKLALGERGIDERLEVLFARGIDPADEAGVANVSALWPSRDEVRAYAAEADRRIEAILTSGCIEDDTPCLRRGEATLAILEHEAMHQETLLYMFHELDAEKKRPVAPFTPLSRAEGHRIETRMVPIPAGKTRVGADAGAFGWDNEFAGHEVDVDAFTIDRTNVTNAQYLEFMNATGATAPHFWVRRDDSWYWRGLFGETALDPDGPVWVTHDEASAFARWRGMRLPTEAEYHRAAFGTPEGIERRYPWGDEQPDARRGNFGFVSWDPMPVGSFPAGASAWGVEDLVGNGWEWTSTPFLPFDGFEPMPSYPVYSTDFFDGEHFVMKGASPVTDATLVRRSFRNWFRPNYPYVWASFRCVK